MGIARIGNRKGSINRRSGASFVFLDPASGTAPGPKTLSYCALARYYLLRAATFAGVFPLFSHHILAA